MGQEASTPQDGVPPDGIPPGALPRGGLNADGSSMNYSNQQGGTQHPMGNHRPEQRQQQSKIASVFQRSSSQKQPSFKQQNGSFTSSESASMDENGYHHGALHYQQQSGGQQYGYGRPQQQQYPPPQWRQPSGGGPSSSSLSCQQMQQHQYQNNPMWSQEQEYYQAQQQQKYYDQRQQQEQYQRQQQEQYQRQQQQDNYQRQQQEQYHRQQQEQYYRQQQQQEYERQQHGHFQPQQGELQYPREDQEQRQYYSQRQQYQQHPPRHPAGGAPASSSSAAAYAGGAGPINPKPRPPLPPPGGAAAADHYPPSHHRSHHPPIVSVMYASESPPIVPKRPVVGGSSGRSDGYGGPPSSSMMPTSAGGADLSGQMRDLSLLGSGMVTASSAAATAAHLKTTGLSNDESEWEAKWDEDDESSGGEDEVEYSGSGVPLSGPGGAMAVTPGSSSSAAAVHQPFRPSMDGAHSSSSPIKRPAAVVVEPVERQAMAAAAAAVHRQPPMRMENVPPSFISGQQENEEEVLKRQADMVLQEGVQWDTASAAGGRAGEEAEKPNVQMFFPLLRVLGKGSFGKVVLVQKRTGQERGSLFAMKILRKAHLVKRRQIERTKTERKVLAVVDHPFIMKLHFAFQTEDKLYLVLDYCPGGELFFHLSRYRRFPERVARFYAAELLLAIGHLHKRGIIYRDLKPENVLLDAEGHVKLGDFGLAKDKIRHPCEGATSMCGTPEYMAPEVLSQSGHGFCVDYWGLGMLVYEMMTGLPPWYTTDRAKLFRRLKSAPLEIPSYFSPQSASYVSALLERNPRRRLGVQGIRSAMEHEFFGSLKWRDLYARRLEAPIRPCEGWKPPEPVSRGNSTVNENMAVGISYSAAGQMSGSQNQASGQIEKISGDAIDLATANFDSTFTRMPVHTMDNGNDAQDSGDEGGSEELHENTFVGFTFDEVEQRNNFSAASGRSIGNPSSPQSYGARRN